MFKLRFLGLAMAVLCLGLTPVTAKPDITRPIQIALCGAVSISLAMTAGKLLGDSAQAKDNSDTKRLWGFFGIVPLLVSAYCFYKSHRL
jgi:hypothetical protein